jgi:2-aminoadipate transaminase
MMAALAQELPEVTHERPAGGYYLWLTLPAGVDGDELALAANAAGVTIIGGSKFFARSDAGHPTNHVRLAFSHAAHDEIDEGVRRLAYALASIAGGVLSVRNG